MKKRTLLAMALTLVMCFGLVMPALALEGICIKANDASNYTIIDNNESTDVCIVSSEVQAIDNLAKTEIISEEEILEVYNRAINAYNQEMPVDEKWQTYWDV